MTTIDDRLERGKRAFADVMTFPAPDNLMPATASLLEFVFAEVWQRPAMNRRDRWFVTLPCVAAADAEMPLRDHVYAALNSGDVSITEMQEMVLHFAVYAGWPKASRFNMTVDEQWDRIHRERGRAGTAARAAAATDDTERPGRAARGGRAVVHGRQLHAVRTDSRQSIFRSRHLELRLRRDVAAARTRHEAEAACDRSVCGFPGRADTQSSVTSTRH